MAHSRPVKAPPGEAGSRRTGVPPAEAHSRPIKAPPGEAGSYHIETLGCPKNQVDSDKLEGTLAAAGLAPADGPAAADVVVVNTCAFIEEARRESVDAILALAEAKRPSARLVVTGCLAERYGDELAQALPEADRIAGFGAPLIDPPPATAPGRSLGPADPPPTGAAPARSPGPAPAAPPSPARAAPVAVELGARRPPPEMDLLNLPRPPSPRPWAYVKIAEGCDRACGFCAIPGFRGPQRSRPAAAILDEVAALGVKEAVLVAQDLASYGRDQGRGRRRIVPLIEAAAELVDRVRLLYLYPSDLTGELIEAVIATGVAYFDLSLQHVSAPLLRRMRRWGSGPRFLERIAAIRRAEPEAAFRSSFIVGYPGETEADHDELLRFLEEAQLDWCGFFAYSEEAGTHAAGLDGKVSAGLRADRLAELRELQDPITACRRDLLVGRRVEVLVDEPGSGRTHREAPEIDGLVRVPGHLPAGTIAPLTVTASAGIDLTAA